MELARARIESGTPTEIVSCDSMQVYRGMDIGTAKPTPADRSAVRHHLIDLVDPSEDHNLPRFLQSARGVLEDIEARGSSALLVGGTGLYVRALVDGFTPPPHFPEIAAELERTEDTTALAARLCDLDPLGVSRIPAGNRRRIIRALEVSIGTGVPFSAHGGALERYGPTPFVLCGIRPDRRALAEAINTRYDSQMAAGFLAEVKVLSEAQPPMSRTARQALGYRDLLDHLCAGTDLDDALSAAKTRTRRFAVRQLRWFGRDPRIRWFEPPGPEHSAAQVAAELDLLWRERAAGETCSTSSVEPALPSVSPARRSSAAPHPRSGNT
jgi:tRNA dimethylallyltransferase